MSAETFSTDGPTCPHCGYVERDLDAHHYDESTCELTCNSCGADYAVEIYKSISWTSRPLVETVRGDA